ncbi:MAG: HAD-IIB family hydrolase [Elusimicrobiota bacterium]|nr:HAD-IIB family hydrolase [Elusimicrobiota bacterium]
MSNESLYLFDLDGTLTPARLPMEEYFARRFIPFIKTNSAYIVSGSDIVKVKEQIPSEIFFYICGIFSSMGNEIYKKGEKIFSRPFVEDALLVDLLTTERKRTKYPFKLFPNYLEKRCGAINFSVLGRDCPHSERIKYKNWDDSSGERKEIVDRLKKLCPGYEFSIGGNISIDIVKKGFGKEQVIDILRKEFPKTKIIFFGDKIDEGGNDYSLVQYLRAAGNYEIHGVENPKECLEILGI